MQAVAKRTFAKAPSRYEIGEEHKALPLSMTYNEPEDP